MWIRSTLRTEFGDDERHSVAAESIELGHRDRALQPAGFGQGFGEAGADDGRPRFCPPALST
jgi:hypothetical protein